MNKPSSSSSFFSSSRPMSSPGRPDKFPPPLMRFLRSNTRITRFTAATTTPRSRLRSRSRSRATPLFSRRKPRSAAAAVQEPSSPKVTCIGQVRARRSKPKSAKPKSRITKCDSGEETRCDCVRRATLFCKPAKGKIRLRKGKPGWRKWIRWVSFFQCHSTENDIDLTRNGSGRANRFVDLDDEKQSTRREILRGVDFVSIGEKNMSPYRSQSSSSVPPKNALLLTRCRSAPHRDSSFVVGIWVDETGEGAENKQSIENKENKVPISSNEGSDEDNGSKSKIDGEFDKIDGELNVVDGLIGEKLVKKTEAVGIDQSVNLMLKRCNSEPTRGSGRFDPNRIDFGKQRGLGFSDP